MIVEEGSGNPAANAYVTVEEADDILAPKVYAHDWAALPVGTKERLLQLASQFLDWRVQWHGQRQDPDSGLCWPRFGAVDRDGYQVPPYTVPRAVRVATALMARALIDRDRTAEASHMGLRSLTVDSVSIVFESAWRMPSIPEHVGHVILGLGRIVGGSPNFRRVAR